MLSSAELKKAFDEFDLDKSGTLEAGELAKVCSSVGIEADEAKLKAFFDQIDTDHDGKISFEEFSAWYRVGQTSQGGLTFNLVKSIGKYYRKTHDHLKLEKTSSVQK